LQQQLLADELDVAIYAHPGLAAEVRLSHLPLYREPFVVVVKAAHRLARRGAVRMEDLRGEPYLWRAHCEHDAATDAALRQSGFSGPPAFQSDQDAWVLAMAAAGLGYGLMPAHSAAHHGVAALALTEPEIAREIALVTVRGRPQSGAVGALVHEVMRMRWPGAVAVPVVADEAGARQRDSAAIAPL
jgi:LysR family transcriptional regulator, hydrogen peroxide-inducible genes activator